MRHGQGRRATRTRTTSTSSASWLDTRDALHNTPTQQGLSGYAGNPPGTIDASQTTLQPSSGGQANVILAPSFNYIQVSTDAAAQNTADQYSWLSGGGQAALMTWDTDTLSNTRKSLVFQQGPLFALTITVTDMVSGHTSTYDSDAIPTYMVAMNGPQGTFKLNFDGGIFDIPNIISSFIRNFIHDMYEGFVGGPMEALSKNAASDFLAVPALEPYVVNGYNAAGDPIYQLKTENDGSSIIDPAILKEDGAAAIKADNIKDPDIVPCTVAANNPADMIPFSHPDPTRVDDPKTGFRYGDCYAPNTIYSIWNISQALMFLLIMIAMFQYAFMLLRGSGRNMAPLGFITRMVLRKGLHRRLLSAWMCVVMPLFYRGAQITARRRRRRTRSSR